MLDISMLIALLQDPAVQSFLISLAAGVFWDGGKKAVSHFTRKEPSIEEQLLEIITDTMRQFYNDPIYGFQGETYQEAIVMKEFCKQFSKYNGVASSGVLRLIVDGTIYPGLSDMQYNRWIDIFIENCSANPTICRWIANQDQKKKLFINRNSTLQRIEAKLKGYLEDAGNKNADISDARFDGIIEKLNDEFCLSWKNSLLTLVDKLARNNYSQIKFENKLAFIRSNEDCGEILAQIKEILPLCDLENSDRRVKKQLYDLIEHISFNKVLVITGTTGAGKSFFTYQYIQKGIQLLQEEMAEIIPCVIDCRRLRNTSCFEQAVLQQLGEFLGINISSLDAAYQNLECLPAKICFVVDNIHTIIDQVSDWWNIVTGIKKFSQYETFKWILTINSYDYYILEETYEFLQRYCVKRRSILMDDSGKSKIFEHTLDIDELNQNWGVIKHILEDQFGVTIPGEYEAIRQGISTPLEAVYFGECAAGKPIISFPSTYYDYIMKIVSWKSDALAAHGHVDIQRTLLKIVDYVADQKSCLIQIIDTPESDLNTFRHVQLLSKIETKTTDIFSAAQSFPNIAYQLRVLPYWAAKIVGTRFRAGALHMDQLFSFPFELKEWLIPCYIFINFEQEDKWDDLFSALKNEQLLEYALFCAQRSSSKFCRALYEFLHQNEECVSSSKTCYAVLHFLYYCPLKMSEKFSLLRIISDQVEKFHLTKLYERVFNFIADTACKTKNLKKNMLILTTCGKGDINFISGYGSARIFMRLIAQENKDFDLVLWDIINYIEDHNLSRQITVARGHNSSFMDFFIRKCFEEHICSSSLSLEGIYQHLEGKFFQLEYPVGSYIRRNLTCAAGNVFSSRRKFLSGYNKQYIKLTDNFARSNEVDKKKTAYFLIKNSLSEDNSTLEPELQKILLDLITNRTIKRLYTRDHELFGLE